MKKVDISDRVLPLVIATLLAVLPSNASVRAVAPQIDRLIG
jgi:hypothetical protein